MYCELSMLQTGLHSNTTGVNILHNVWFGKLMEISIETREKICFKTLFFCTLLFSSILPSFPSQLAPTVALPLFPCICIFFAFFSVGSFSHLFPLSPFCFFLQPTCSLPYFHREAR